MQNVGSFKPWSNELDLRLTRVSFGHPLVSTCIDFGRAQIRMQVDASFSPFGHPMQVATT